MSHEFEEERRVNYDFGGEIGEASFVPRCPVCFRFVKADETIYASLNGLADEFNATCSKHGRVKMLFEGFF